MLWFALAGYPNNLHYLLELCELEKGSAIVRFLAPWANQSSTSTTRTRAWRKASALELDNHEGAFLISFFFLQGCLWRSGCFFQRNQRRLQ
jgi:hypothetical protein